MSKLPLKSDRQPEGHLMVSLESLVSRAIHAASATIPERGWLLDGGQYTPDPCRAIDRIGCHVAAQIRVVRRVLGWVSPVSSVTFITRTPETVDLLSKWLAGEEGMPSWYVLSRNNRRRRRSGLERARMRMQEFPGQIAIVPTSQANQYSSALAQAAELTTIALEILGGKCPPDVAAKQANTAVGI